MDNFFEQLSDYESNQVKQIQLWKAEKPGVISDALGIMVKPAAWLVEKVVPEKAIVGLLDGANGLGKILSDQDDILRDAEVGSIEDLRSKDLYRSDKLADEVHNWAIGLAIAQGGLTGATGLLGMAANVPAVITLGLRTIHKIGLCYGFKAKKPEDDEFILNILSLSGSNSMYQKHAALLNLQRLHAILSGGMWWQIQRDAAGRISHEAGLIAIRNLAKQLGVNLTKRKALQTIPFIGAVVGSSIDGWYLKEVGWAARRVFQEKWLITNNKLQEPIDINSTFANKEKSVFTSSSSTKC